MDSEGRSSQLGFEQQVAAITALFGPNVVQSMYASLGAFFVRNLGSPSFYAAMLLCLYVPFSLIVFAQELADAFFDLKFSTSATYYFRVILMHLVLGVIAIVWMVIPQSSNGVLAIGVCIGIAAGASISSAKQLSAAMDPRLTTYAAIGAQLGNVQPMLVFFFLGFEPSASLLKLRLAVTCVVVICIFTSVILNFMHFGSDVFAKAYQRLQYDVHPQEESFEPVDSARQVTETLPLLPEHAKNGVPRWVWTWCTVTGILTGVKMCLVSLSACFGDSALTQTLILMQFAVEFLGMLAALQIPHISCFAEGPWHRVLASISLTIAGLAVVQFWKLGGGTVALPLFLLSWGALNALWSFTCCLIEVTANAYVRVIDRKLVTRRNFFAKCGCGILGLTAGLLISRILHE